MRKVYLKYHLKSNLDNIFYEGEGIYQNDIITFCDKDKTKVTINIIDGILKRENKEMFLFLDFKNETAVINVKELNKKLDLKIEVNNIIKSTDKIEVNYILNNDNYYFELNWNMIGD